MTDAIHQPGTMPLDGPERPKALIEALAAAMMPIGAWHELSAEQRQELRRVATEVLGVFERLLSKVMVERRLGGQEGAFHAFPDAAEAVKAAVAKENPVLRDGVQRFLSQLYAWWLAHQDPA